MAIPSIRREPPQRNIPREDYTDPVAFIPPETERWSARQRIGFLILAVLPILFLVGAVLTGLASSVTGGGAFDAAAIMLYVHFPMQFLVLGIYAHVLFSNRSLTSRAKTIWALLFLFVAPAAVFAYWYIHVWRAEAEENRHYRVVDLDSTGDEDNIRGRRQAEQDDHHPDDGAPVGARVITAR